MNDGTSVVVTNEKPDRYKLSYTRIDGYKDFFIWIDNGINPIGTGGTLTAEEHRILHGLWQDMSK